MKFGFRRHDSQVGVVIISGSCCIPGMAPLDEQARRLVDQALSETGVVAQVKVMPAPTAFFGGAPKEVMARLVSDFNSGRIGVPAILVNGKAVSYGVPDLENLKSALLEAAGLQTSKEEQANE